MAKLRYTACVLLVLKCLICTELQRCLLFPRRNEITQFCLSVIQIIIHIKCKAKKELYNYLSKHDHFNMII